MKNKRNRLPLRILLGVLLVIVLAVVGYVAYVLLTYHRIDDMQPLDITGNADQTAMVQPGETYTVIAYNIGFGAYTPDFSFFMDGGTQSRAASKESVEQCTAGAAQVAAKYDPDFIMFEEVDLNSTRSWHVDQKHMLDEHLTGYDTACAVNYDSAYLMVPPTDPHGKSLSSLGFYSRFPVTSALRRSLPITDSIMKLVDLDRCYIVSRVPMANGTELVLYTVHLTAYTSDHTVIERQLEMLRSDMEAETAEGNTVICGGDFNMEMRAREVSDDAPMWAHPLDRQALGSIVDAWDAVGPATESDALSCRDAAEPYLKGRTLEWTLDAFVTSSNVVVEHIECIDTGYAYSDHNPVMMTFHIEP